MANRGQVAGAERKAKEREPVRFCPFPHCLWRLRTFEEMAKGWCRRHAPQACATGVRNGALDKR
jgi:hypothetical protein